jgi:hypothetical protein
MAQINAKSLATTELSTPCTSCGNSLVVAHILQRYHALFGIPLYPLRKVTVTECTHCKQKLSEEELPVAYHIEIYNKLPAVRTPWYMFTGLVLAVLFLGGIFYIQYGERQDTARYISDPQVNDFYVVDAHQMLGLRESKYKYGVLRINSVNADSLGFWAGVYQYQSDNGAIDAIQDGEVKADDYFVRVEIPIEKTEIQEMLAKGYIIRVIRNNR